MPHHRWRASPLRFDLPHSLAFPPHSYEPGMGEPLIIAAPGVQGGNRTAVLASSLDLLPTMLDWAGVTFQPYALNGVTVNLTGKSLLPYLGGGAAGDSPVAIERPSLPVPPLAPPPIPANATRIYASFQLHEIDEYYPMRV